MSPKRRLIMFCIPVLFVLLAFATAEVFLRLQRASFREANRQVENTFRAAQTPELIYERIPYTEETNNHGFRGEDYSLEKPSDAWRIVVVGDSIARGRAIELEQTFGKQLQRFLNHQRPPETPRAEVFLLAETGYNTAQELMLLEHKALDYQPDLIIWAYSLDDPGHALFHNQDSLHSRYFHQPPSLAFSEFKRLLFKARERIQGYGEKPEFYRSLHKACLHQLQQHMQQLAAITREAGVPVLLLVIPVLEVDKLAEQPDYVLTPMNYSLLDVHTLVARMALQNGISVVEGLDAFSGRPLRDIILSKDDMWHPNPAGHELLALQLQKHMLRHGPLPGN